MEHFGKLDTGFAASQSIIDAIILIEQVNILNRRELEPEFRLMLAVLEEAFRALERYFRIKSKKNTKEFNQVINWMSSSDTSWLYSFTTICDTFDLNASAVRKISLFTAEITAKKKKRTKEEKIGDKKGEKKNKEKRKPGRPKKEVDV